MLIRKKSLKIQERLGMRIGIAYGSAKTPVVKKPSEALNVLEDLYRVGFRAFLLPKELFANIKDVSDLYKEQYTSLLKIKTIASKYNIELSIHNNSLPEEPALDNVFKIYCNIANVMDARSLVVHPNFYGRMPHSQALKLTVYKINEIVNEMRIRSKVGIETTGHVDELGSLEDVVDMVKRTTRTEPVLNWAHIHGRDRGVLTHDTDFRKIVDKVRAEVGHQWINDAYFIFSGADYDRTGAGKHKSIARSDMRLEHLIKTIQALNIKGTLIFETPNREKDIVDILQDLADMVR
ncbi:MAG: TIM barrel protein [Candidatus Aenigmatarchaeota archaeon]